MVGWNITDGTAIAIDGNMHNSAIGVPLPDVKQAKASGSWIVPDDFSSGLTIKVVVYNAVVSANSYGQSGVVYGACGESLLMHSNNGSLAADAITAANRNCIQSVSVANAVAGDMVDVRYTRTATDVLDTMGATVWVLGFVAEYTADG